MPMINFCNNLRVTLKFELRVLTLLFLIEGIARLDFTINYPFNRSHVGFHANFLQ